MSRTRRLERLNSELSAKERALLVLQSWKEEREEEPGWRKGKGNRLQVNVGSFFEWLGAGPKAWPEWGLAYDVLPDDQADLIESRRQMRQRARDSLEAGPGLAVLHLKNWPEAQKIVSDAGAARVGGGRVKLARYRCAFPDCRAVTEGAPERAPPCSRCGRRTVRILGPVRVRVIKDRRGWPR